MSFGLVLLSVSLKIFFFFVCFLFTFATTKISSVFFCFFPSLFLKENPPDVCVCTVYMIKEEEDEEKEKHGKCQYEKKFFFFFFRINLTLCVGELTKRKEEKKIKSANAIA